MDEKSGNPGSSPDESTGSDEFRKIDDPFGSVIEEGEFKTAGEDDHSPPPPPSVRPGRLSDGAFAASIISVTAILTAGIVAVYALSGGFDPPGGSGAGPAHDRPEAESGSSDPGAASPSSGNGGDSDSLIRDLKERLEALEKQKIDLQLEARRWKARAVGMSRADLDAAVKKFLSEDPERREAGRKALAESGGDAANALMEMVQRGIVEQEKLRREIADLSEKAEAALKSLRALTQKLSETETRKAIEEAQEFYRQGYRQSEAGDAGKADASFTRAVELDPSFDAAFNARGLVRMQVSGPGAALPDFERACVLNPASHLFEFNRGSALAGLGRKAEAAKAFERAVRLKPGFAEALKMLRMLEEGR